MLFPEKTKYVVKLSYIELFGTTKPFILCRNLIMQNDAKSCVDFMTLHTYDFILESNLNIM